MRVNSLGAKLLLSDLAYCADHRQSGGILEAFQRISGRTECKGGFTTFELGIHLRNSGRLRHLDNHALFTTVGNITVEALKNAW